MDRDTIALAVLVALIGKFPLFDADEIGLDVVNTIKKEMAYSAYGYADALLWAKGQEIQPVTEWETKA